MQLAFLLKNIPISHGTLDLYMAFCGLRGRAGRETAALQAVGIDISSFTSETLQFLHSKPMVFSLLSHFLADFLHGPR